MARLEKDPIAKVIEVFNECFPNDETPIIYMDSNNPENENLYFDFVQGDDGYIVKKRRFLAFYDNKNKRVVVDPNNSILAIVALLAHELAHAVTIEKCQDNPHGNDFKAVESFIMIKFAKVANFEIEEVNHG